MKVGEDSWGRDAQVIDAIKRYSVYGNSYVPVDVLEEISNCRLFHEEGRQTVRERTQSLE